MSNIPEEYIDYIRRIVDSFIDQLDTINVRWLRGVTRINGAEWSEVNYGVTVCTSTTRPTAFDGRPIYETDTDKFYIYDGALWEEIVGTAGTMANPATENLDMADYDIVGANVIQATASQDLILKVSTGSSIVFQAV